jgi:PAS domain S-box-containing protein
MSPAPLPGVPECLADGPSGAGWAPDAITLACGLLCAAIGATVMVAWLARATAVLRFGSQSPMVFNTALALAVTGAALVALVAGWPRPAMVAGVFDLALGLAALAEYLLGRGLGIDQLIVRAYLSGPAGVPGRPAANAAVCLTLAGAALLARGPRRSAALAAAGSVIAAIAAVAAFGYVIRTPARHGWAQLSNMPFLAAAAMLVLAICLLSAAWRETRGRHAGFPRWFPIPAGVLALGLAAVTWVAVAGRGEVAGRISAGNAAGAATVLGLVLAVLVGLTAWLAQQADQRRRTAAAEAAWRAEAETQARGSEQRLFQILDAMPIGIFAASPGSRPYYANPESKRILGRDPEAANRGSGLPEAYGAFVAGTERPYPAESMPIVRALHGQSSRIDDMEIHQPDGGVIPIEVWGRPVYGSHGEIGCAIAAFADMSERNARERTIVAQAALLELVHDAIFVRDPADHITYWNTGAERTYGFTRAEAIGRVSYDLLRTEFPGPFADIEAATARDGHWEGELTHQCADGRIIIVESRWAAQCAPDGSLLGFIQVNRDITARKDAEREIRRAAEEIRALNTSLEQQVRQRTMHLERANQNMEAFAYSIAHDLRTPLRGISGFAQALVEDYGDQLDDTGREYAGRVQAGCTRMATLIDDLLHLSRVTRAPMNLQDVDLSAEVTASCDQLRTRDPSRQVQMTVQDGVRATADRALIRSALENLLENAWKFTAGRDGAAIEFGTTPAGDAALCCYVRDNGAGFDPAYAGKLFQPFQRLHDATEFPGTGIGLASVRRIIERHGGRTWAEGAVDGGATIYFTLNAKDTP